jgi:hypothetical protein
MNKIKKSRKVFSKKNIVITLFVVLVILSAGILYKMFGGRGDDWQLRVSDVSRACYSNVLHVYSNKDYVVRSSIGNRVIDHGTSSYPNSIDYLENEIKNYLSDAEFGMNYEIESKNSTDVLINQYNSPEFKKFIDTIDVENLFWCD